MKKDKHILDDKMSFYDFLKFTDESIDSLEKNIKSLQDDDLPSSVTHFEENSTYEIY